MDIFFDLNSRIFTHGFIKDANRLATNQLLNRAQDQSAIYNEIDSPQTHIIYGPSLGQVCQQLGDLIFNNVTLYQIWSDERKIDKWKQELTLNEARNAWQHVNTHLLNRPSSAANLTEVFACALQVKTVHKRITMTKDEARYEFTDSFVEAVHLAKSLNDVESLFENYGTCLPLCSYTSKEIKYMIVKASSFTETDSSRLVARAIESIETCVQSGWNFEHVQQLDTSRGLCEIILEPVSPTKQTTIYHPVEYTSISWMPIHEIMEREQLRYGINQQQITLVKRAWLLREKNFHYLNESGLSLLSKIKQSKFKFEDYWRECVYWPVRASYARYVNFDEDLATSHLDRFLDYTFGEILPDMAIYAQFYMKNVVVYLSESENVIEFLNDNTNAGRRICVMGFDPDLIKNAPDTWEKILSKHTTLDTVGVLVNYDVHTYLSEKPDFRDFYKKYFLVINYVPKDYLTPSSEYMIWWNRMVQELIGETTVKLRLTRFDPQAKPEDLVFKNQQNLEDFMKRIGQASDFRTIFREFDKKSGCLNRIVECLREKAKPVYFNSSNYNTDADFKDLVRILDLESQYRPVSIDRNDSNSFYKSVSLFVYGTTCLWPVLKLGIAFIIFQNRRYFEKSLADSQSTMTYEQLLIKVCQEENSFADFCSLAALHTLLKRPISCFSLSLDKRLLYWINYSSGDETLMDLRHAIYLGIQLLPDCQENRFAPILPVDDNSLPIDLVN